MGASASGVWSKSGAWSNWAGNQTATGLETHRPTTTEEVAEIVRAAAGRGLRVKATGSGRSCSGISCPESVRLDLSRLNGLHSSDPVRRTATVGAGTSVGRLNDLLAGVGLALPAVGGIGTRTVGGLLSTGSHGTGISSRSPSAQVLGVELVLADGSVVTCSPTERPELWDAARVGLGALGALTRVTLSCVPLFGVRMEETPVGLDELIERFPELVASCDHFEARWWPHTAATVVGRGTRLHLAEGLDRLPGWKERIGGAIVGGAGLSGGLFAGLPGGLPGSLPGSVLEAIVAASRVRPALVPPLNRLASRLAGRAAGRLTRTDLSFKVFVGAPERTRCTGAEYALPLDGAAEAIRDVVGALTPWQGGLPFPVEIRVGAADDIPLSTAYGRDTVYLAFRVPAGEDHTAYLRLVSRVLDPYGARPHWGELHDLDAELLRTRYPRFDEFVQVRDRVDPAGVFSNRYLDRVLGPTPGRRSP